MHQSIFFLPEYGGEAQNWDEGLDLAGAMGQTAIFYRDAHRSADQRTVLVHATASVRLQRWTGMMVKFCGQPVDLLIGPIVERIGAGQLWESCLHCGGMLHSTLFDSTAVIRQEAGKSLLESANIEEGDRKGTDATAGASKSAGNFTEQGCGSPLEPVVSFFI